MSNDDIALPIPRSLNFEDNLKKRRAGCHDNCIVCGLPVKSTCKTGVHVVLGGCAWVHPDDEDRWEVDMASDLGWQPVGANCYKYLMKQYKEARNR